MCIYSVHQIECDKNGGDSVKTNIIPTIIVTRNLEHTVYTLYVRTRCTWHNNILLNFDSCKIVMYSRRSEIYMWKIKMKHYNIICYECYDLIFLILNLLHKLPIFFKYCLSIGVDKVYYYNK